MEGKTEELTCDQDIVEMSEELTTNAKSEEKPLLQQELPKDDYHFSNALFVHNVNKKPADLTDDLLKCSRFCNEVICSHKTVYGDYLGFEEDTKILGQMIGMEFNLNGKEVEMPTDNTPEHEQYSQEPVLLMKDNKKCEDPPTKHRQANCLDQVDRDYKQQIYGLQTSPASPNSRSQTNDDGSSSNVSEDQNEDHNSSSSIGNITQHSLNNNQITNVNRKKSSFLANQIQRVLNSEDFKYYYDSNSNALFSDSDILPSLNNIEYTHCNDKQGNPSFYDNLNNNGNTNCGDQKIPKNLHSKIILNQAQYKYANQPYQFTNPQQHRFTNPQQHRFTNPQQHRFTNPQQHRFTNPQQHRFTNPQQHRFTNPQQYHSMQPYRFASPQQNKSIQQYQSTYPQHNKIIQPYQSTNPEQNPSIQQYQSTNPQQNQPTNHEQYQSTNPPHFQATNHSQYPSRRLPYTSMFQTQNKNSTPQNCIPHTHSSFIPQPHESILRELAAMQTNSSFKHPLPTTQPQYLPTTQSEKPPATQPQDLSTTLQQDLSKIEAHQSILESLSAMFPYLSPELQFPGGQNPPLIPNAQELTYEDFERICLGLGLYSLQRKKFISDQKALSDMYEDYQKTWQQRYQNHPAVKPEVDFSDPNQANRWGLLQFESYRAGESFYQFNGRAVNIQPPSESRPGPVHITSDETDDEMDPELLKNITQSESKSNRLLQLDHILNPSYRKTQNALDRKALRDAFRWRSLKTVNMSSTPNVSRKESEQRQNSNGATPEISPIVVGDSAPGPSDGAPGPSDDRFSTRNGASAFPESSQPNSAPQSQVINTPVTSGKSNARPVSLLQSGTTSTRMKPPVGSLFRNAK